MPVLQPIHLTLLLVTILSGCASLPDKIVHPIEPLVAQSNSTLSALTDTYLTNSSDMSAVLLLESGWDALAQRLALIEMAEHSIDIQYYIWNSDVSGRYLASRLLAAADRGVHVRVMLDDINLNQRDDLLATLDEHAQIEIRIFNPIPSRGGTSKLLHVLKDFSRLNRRMHNKSFTVDGTLSIVGGRNIGDEYFDLSNELNFRDRDVLVAGPVIADIQTSFGEYWDSLWSYPVNLLANKTLVDLTMLHNVAIPQYRHYPALPETKEGASLLIMDAMSEFFWGHAYFVSDDPIPLDVKNSNKPKATARLLGELAEQANQEILLESAYLIMDERQLEKLQRLTNKGVQVKALTNSMSSNDLLTNHSGYASKRQAMLKHGMQLFELKADTNLCVASTKDVLKCAPTADYGLHAKSAVFDRKIAFIGSFNFNLRSTYLNTESILIIENQALAEQLANNMLQAMHQDNSWRLGLHEGNLHWYSGTKMWTSEPETDRWQRIKSRFLQLLPIEKYL